MSSSICIIPARAGSKRIPEKNIRKFCGQIMLSRSIQTAQDSGLFKEIIVSTDSEKIANIALQYGATVPFMRPKNLADDHTGTREVIIHAIKQLELFSAEFNDVCCLYATAPFTTPHDLRLASKLLHDSIDHSFVFTATSFPYPVQRALQLNAKGYASFIDPSASMKRSQDLLEFYHDAGQFYWGTLSSWKIKKNILDGGRPLLIPRWRVQDIDTEEDWIHAELLFKAIHSVSSIHF